MGLAALGGMSGHGLRFLALHAGCRLETATFLGCLAVGVISGVIARHARIPVAVIAFAGAVAMMPGMHIYRALAGTIQIARQMDAADSALVAQTLGTAVQACLVVAGLGLGLVLGMRTVQWLPGTSKRHS